MPVQNRSARETLVLPDQAGVAGVAPWAVFDVDWYRASYTDAPDLPAAELLEWHLAYGQAMGFSPNRYFEEAWQRQSWAGIQGLIDARSVASAFDAWCRGPNATRQPHWLFDPREYRTRYPAMTEQVLDANGFFNRYHHYLRFGATEGRIGHPLFNPAIYLASLDQGEAGAAEAMPFRHYLIGLETGAKEYRTSLLFDPDWYREQYPEAARAVETGQYRSLLEHYLRNNRPTEFDPSPWFSETHYLAENRGLAESIGLDGFRNGFAHFLAFGLHEGRSPHPELDLAWYAGRSDVAADIAAQRAQNAYEHWITIGYEAGLPGRAQVEIRVTEPQAIALYRQRANTIWPLYGRHKLDFARGGAASISVIMAVRHQFAETMISLASLRAQYRGEIDLILIDSDPALPGVDIETHVAGATILRFRTLLNDAAAREAGLICANAGVILLLGDGVDLAPGAIDAALARLTGDPTIAAVGGRLVQAHGMLFEAGGIVWRNGHLQAYARDLSPLAAEANFVRDVDFCSTLFLLARRDVLTSLPEQQTGIAGTTHDAADLCVRIQQAGHRVVYEPDAIAFLTKRPFDRVPNGRTAFVAAHPDYLAARPAFDPAEIIHARSPNRGQARVLFVEDSVPLRRIGSGFVRSNDVLHCLAGSGASVTVFPMRTNQYPLSVIRAELPATVEVMHEMAVSDFASFTASRRDWYDVIWIARTHNLDQIHEALASLVLDTWVQDNIAEVTATVEEIQLASLFGQKFDLEPSASEGPGQFDMLTNLVASGVTDAAPDPQQGPVGGVEQIPHPRVIIDTEAVASVRLAEQAALLDQNFDLNAALSQEFAHLKPLMDVVAVTDAEAAIIGAHHKGNVSVLGHAIAASPTPRRFEERTGILFVGAIHGMNHPNYDGLTWFIDTVLPLIERSLRWETRLTVAGYTAPDVTLDRFKAHPRVTLRGAVSDLVPLYDANRVFIAPTRFAAGIPYKVHEAAAFGLPVVASTLLARQLGWADAEAIGAADVSDPAGFAARVIALHRDAALWTRIREAALARVATELDPRDFAARVSELARTSKRGGVGLATEGRDEE